MGIAIIGLGLMGGSLAMALKQKSVCREVVALVRRSETVKAAAGIVDFATTEPAEALPQADVVIFSTPVRVIIRQLPAWVDFYKAGAIITDMGSTKQAILQAMDTLPPQFHPLGSHPMCGKEQAGLEAAEADLFVDAPWIITPLPRTPPTALQLITELAQSIGAWPRLLAADRHDRLVATISHLPYTLAATLVLTAQEAAVSDPAVWEVAASGFRDTSRLAASDITMMLDILLTNQAVVGQMITQAQAKLGQLAQALAAGDESALQTMLEQAAAQRQGLYQQSNRVAK